MATSSSELAIATTPLQNTCRAEPSILERGTEASLCMDDEAKAIRLTIRQDPMSVTLDGTAMVAVAFSILFSLHLFQPGVVTALVVLTPAIVFIHHDYQNYLKLGPGGTPSTFAGYLRISWYKLWPVRDPFTPIATDPVIEPHGGILSRKVLPYRCGPRPKVAGIAPQRQLDQHGSRQCYLALRQILLRHSERHVDAMGIGTSCFEKHGMGLFARFPVNRTCQGEICHVHDSDYSMHLNLHPDDAREVLEKGWGQRHPLAVQGWLKMPVPKEFVMVYAPRSSHELEVVCLIIKAAGWWVMAKEFEMEMLENEI